MQSYDLIVIGAGPGGYTAAIRAAQRGLKTAIVERRDIGGTCLNRGCIPTKALLHAGSLYASLQQTGTFGIQSGQPAYDLAQIHARKDKVVSQLRDGVTGLLKGSRVDILQGSGRVTGGGEVTVDGTAFAAKNIIIATGSEPARPPIEGLDLPGVYTSDDLLEGDVPAFDSLVIIGGGVIGIEFANYYRDLGVTVTVIEALDRILPGLDEDLSVGIARLFKRRKITLYEQTQVAGVDPSAGGLTVRANRRDKAVAVEAEAVLVATGRRPVTDGLFADGLEPEHFGAYLKVNERYETSLPGVYAIGDVVPGMQLAHKAEAEAKRVIDGLTGHEPLEDMRYIPSCVYSRPEIASCGLTEAEARDLGLDYVTARYNTGGNAKTVIEGADRGFFKIIAERRDRAGEGRVLGVHILSDRASDIISEIAVELSAGLTVDDLLRGIRPHPTYGEGLMEALEDLKGESILTPPARRQA